MMSWTSESLPPCQDCKDVADELFARSGVVSSDNLPVWQCKPCFIAQNGEEYFDEHYGQFDKRPRGPRA